MTEQTPPNLLPLLEKIAAENDFKNAKIKVTPITTGGANYTSTLHLADISGDGNDELRLFAKVSIISEKFREETSIQHYDIEIFVYTKLLKIYRQLQDQHELTEKHRLRFPKYYGADDAYLHEVLVLENLASQGFVTHDRFISVDWEYATAAITELAKFHALSMAYEHKNSEEFQEVAHRLCNRMFKDTEGSQSFYDSAVKWALKSVREENKEKLKSFLQWDKFIGYNSFYDTKRRSVLIHADFRPSNMLHRYRKNGALELIVVDYQTMQYGSPVTDLMYFIFSATDGKFRAKYYNKLVNFYHTELGNALARLGLDVENEYSAKDFKLELKELGY